MSDWEIHSKEYKSWAEYLTAARALPPRTNVVGDRNESLRWGGARDVGEALGIADTGWPEGIAKVKSISLPAVNDLSHVFTPDGGWEYDVTGAAYDVGEYLSGVPECWISPTGVSSRPVVRIMCNVTTSAGIPKGMIEMRGAAVVALTLVLQATGYAVQVWKCEGYPISYGADGPRSFHRVCLTDDNGGPLDTDRLLFALAHPAAARVIGYSLGSIIGGGKPGDPLGTPMDPPDSLGWKVDLYLPRAHLRDATWNDAASVGKWVAETYAKLTAGDRTAARG